MQRQYHQATLVTDELRCAFVYTAGLLCWSAKLKEAWLCQKYAKLGQVKLISFFVRLSQNFCFFSPGSISFESLKMMT